MSQNHLHPLSRVLPSNPVGPMRAPAVALDIATAGVGLLAKSRPLRTLTTLALLGGVAYVDLQCAAGAAPKRLRGPIHDYNGRSGFPKRGAEMRGVAARS